MSKFCETNTWLAFWRLNIKSDRFNCGCLKNFDRLRKIIVKHLHFLHRENETKLYVRKILFSAQTKGALSGWCIVGRELAQAGITRAVIVTGGKTLGGKSHLGKPRPGKRPPGGRLIQFSYVFSKTEYCKIRLCIYDLISYIRKAYLVLQTSIK